MQQHFLFKSHFFRYRLMHQKVQIHSVFFIHKKLQFVNASLGGNKMSMFAYKYLHKCLRKISKAICNCRLTAHFTVWALCLIRWFSIKNMYSFFLTQQDIACWTLYSAMFFISQISSFQEITVYELYGLEN